MLAGCASSGGGSAGGSLTQRDPAAGGLLPPAVAEDREPEPFDPAHVSEAPWSFAVYRGRTITTPHYLVHTTIRDERVIGSLPRFLEAAFVRYTPALGTLPDPDTRLVTYLLQDRRQWEAKTREILPDQADTLNRLGRGGFATNGIAILYYLDWGGRSRDTFAIAAHEGWHQYTQTVFRFPLPIWLEEGIATWMEGHRIGRDGAPRFYPRRNGERRRALSSAYSQKRLIPFDELISRTPQSFLRENKETLLTYYAQVWALTMYLTEGDDGRYHDQLADALADAASGQLGRRLTQSPAILARGARNRALRDRVGPWLILACFNEDLDEFEAGYLNFVRDLVRRHDYRR